MLLADGKPASAWILARYRDRLTEQELDLLRSHYQLDDALTTGQIAEKYHVTGQVVLERRHAAARRLGRLIAWELDEPSRRAARGERGDSAEVIDLRRRAEQQRF